MPFLRTLLMFIFVFSLVGVNWSFANKIKNCSNCSSSKNEKGIELNSDENISFELNYGEFLLFQITDELIIEKTIIDAVKNTFSTAKISKPISSTNDIIVEFCGITCLDKYSFKINISKLTGNVVDKKSTFFQNIITGHTITVSSLGGTA